MRINIAKKRYTKLQFLRLYQVASHCPKVAPPEKKKKQRESRWQETMPEAKMPLIAHTTACEHAQEKLAGDLGGGGSATGIFDIFESWEV